MPTKQLLPGTNGTHPAGGSTALPFDPTMPWACALPWTRPPWDGVHVVYDLYQVQAYLDDRYTYMADSRAAGRALDAHRAAVKALPDAPDGTLPPEKQEALDTYQQAYEAWRRGNCLRQLAYFALRLEWPTGETGAAPVPATWDRIPLRLLEWITDTGWELAYAELWDPKSPTPSIPPSPSVPDPPP